MSPLHQLLVVPLPIDGLRLAGVARLDRTTGARERESLALEVDVTRLHFFDPETGLGVDESVTAAAAA